MAHLGLLYTEHYHFVVSALSCVPRRGFNRNICGTMETYLANVVVVPCCSFFPKQFTVGFSLRKKRLAVCPLCPPRIRLASPPNLVRHMHVSYVTALCPPRVRRASTFQTLSALCAPLVFALRVSTMRPPCVPLSTMRASGLCHPLVACCGAGPWHHEVSNSFSALRSSPRCTHAGQFPWHSFWLPNSACASAPYA